MHLGNDIILFGSWDIRNIDVINIARGSEIVGVGTGVGAGVGVGRDEK